MADWNLPTITSDYITGVLPNLNSKDVDAATMAETPTNPPSNYKRWNVAGSKFQNWNGASWDDLVLSIAGGGTGAITASLARTSLGLGTMATQNSNAVAITGGTIAGVTMDAAVITSGILALNRGGTGQSLALGGLGTVLYSNGSAVVFSSGANIANLNASNLSSGSVPDARIVGQYSNITALALSAPSGGVIANSVNLTGDYYINGVKVSIPSGLIALFDAACPSGWTRFSALDGIFPRGAAAYGGSGGSGTTSIDGAHTHGGATGSTSINPDTSHDADNSGLTFPFPVVSSIDDPHNHSIASDGDHSHTFTPPYLDMVYCKKN